MHPPPPVPLVYEALFFGSFAAAVLPALTRSWNGFWTCTAVFIVMFCINAWLISNEPMDGPDGFGAALFFAMLVGLYASACALRVVFSGGAMLLKRAPSLLRSLRARTLSSTDEP